VLGSDPWRRVLSVDQATVIELAEIDEDEDAVLVAQIPRARHDADHTRDFDNVCAWLVTHAPNSTLAELLRIAWRSLRAIIARVLEDGWVATDPFRDSSVSASTRSATNGATATSP
jgi:hypothetical protein